jgi:hypothetical protein
MLQLYIYIYHKGGTKMDKEKFNNELQKVLKQGYVIGKIIKPSTARKDKIVQALERRNNKDALSLIIELVVCSQKPIPEQLIDYTDENFISYAQAFLIGLHNGSLAEKND